MRQLKAQLGQIALSIPRDKPVVCFDYPVYLNVGDLLIMQGTEQFFRDYQYEVLLRASYLNYSSTMAKKLPMDATIVLHGGGNFGNLYPILQKHREQIVADFPRHKVILLPQTVHFSDDLARQASAAIFRAHPDLTLFVRDDASYLELHDAFSDKVLLMPDMAHQLWDDNYAPPSSRSKHTLRLMRNDIEATDRQEDATQGVSADWIDLVSFPQRKTYSLISRALSMEGMLAWQFGTMSAWHWFCNRLINEMRHIFEMHGEVVTSRMHAVIFAALLKKEVRFIDNSYGKLGRYYEKWLKNVDGVTPLV